MHQCPFKMVVCERLCIPIDENKMANLEEPVVD